MSDNCAAQHIQQWQLDRRNKTQNAAMLSAVGEEMLCSERVRRHAAATLDRFRIRAPPRQLLLPAMLYCAQSPSTSQVGSHYLPHFLTILFALPSPFAPKRASTSPC